MKAFKLLGAGLFVLLLAGTVMAASQSPLLNTIWSGDVTTVTTAGVVTPSVGITISFLTESTDLTYLSGTFTLTGGTAVPFSAIRNGNSLAITAVGYSISAEILSYGRCGHGHGSTTPSIMTIKGRSLTDGSMFEGSVSEQG